MHQLRLSADASCTVNLVPASKPRRSTYCAICGVDLRGRFCDPKPAGGNEKPYKGVRSEDTRWLSDVRALRGWEAVDVGGLRVDRSEIGTYDAFQYLGADVLLIGPRVIPLYTTATVPVHDACSEILLAVTTKDNVGNAWRSIQARRGLDGRHIRDCGLASTRQGVCWQEVSGEEFMVTNPLKPLSPIIDSAPIIDLQQMCSKQARVQPVFFSRLPTELVFYILSFLASQPMALLSLRHAEPVVFRLSPFAGNQFWNEVIITEMKEYLPEIGGALGKVRNMEEGKAFAVWSTLRADRSVRNRRRIARLVLQRLGSHGCPSW